MNLDALAATWWAWIASVSLQAALLALVVAAFDVLARRRAWPAVRAAAWWLVLLRLIAPPHWTSPWSLLPAREPVASAATAISDGAGASMPAWPLGFAIAWLAGVALVLALELHHAIALRRELARSKSAPRELTRRVQRLAEGLGLLRVPRVRVASAASSPYAAGAWRATIVVPREMLEDDAPSARRDLALALEHELAHLRRFDALRSAAVRVVRAVFWFHPAAWIASRRLAELRELACDDLVTRGRARRASAYRDALLRVAGRVHGVPHAASGFVAGSSLFLRLERLERRTSRLRALQTPLSALVVAGACACLLPATPAARAIAAASPQVRTALERLRVALDSDERQNCLELQAAAQLVYAHRLATGEDLFAALVSERATESSIVAGRSTEEGTSR